MSSVLKLYSPQLLVAGDGKLFVQIKLGSVTVMRPTPDGIRSFTPAEIREFFGVIVPPMIEELKALRKAKLLKLRRKERNEAKK